MRASLLLLVLSCGAAEPAPAPAPPPAPEESAAVSPRSWRVAWNLVTELGQPTAKVGLWNLENMGAIMVSRDATGAPALDDLLHQEIAARLRKGGMLGVRFEVAAGIVHLHGTLPSRDQAGEVVRSLLEAPGVEQIVSHLAWPGSEQKPLRPRMREAE